MLVLMLCLQLRKTNDELSVVDAQCLEQVTRDVPIITKNVDALKADQKSHQRLLHEFRMKQQERMMASSGGWGMIQTRHMAPGVYPPHSMRMRAPYPRSMDPRQIEFERIHQQRMQLMHGARPPHHMQRPPYMEVGYDVIQPACLCLDAKIRLTLHINVVFCSILIRYYSYLLIYVK